jgi:hypothetical protein
MINADDSENDNGNGNGKTIPTTWQLYSKQEPQIKPPWAKKGRLEKRNPQDER